MKRGIDISKWNDVRSVDKIKSSGIDFVILREGHGFNTDSAFYENVRKFREGRIKIAGVYHFAYPSNRLSSVAEAELCIENLRKVGLEPSNDFIVFYDFEYDSVNELKKVGVYLNREDCNEFTEAFCETIKKAGYNAGVYFNLDFYNNWYDHKLLDRYYKWYADWRKNAQPIKNCVYHQYSSIGEIPGISGNVDLNNCYMEFDDTVMQERDPLIDELISGVLLPLICSGYPVKMVVDELIQNDNI